MRSGKKLVGAAVIGAMLFLGGTAFAQTTTSTTTPGVPNTGVGGDAATNLLVLGTSLAVLVVGGAYLGRKALAR